MGPEYCWWVGVSILIKNGNVCGGPGWLRGRDTVSVFCLLAGARNVNRNTQAVAINLKVCLYSPSKRPWWRDHCFLSLFSAHVGQS